jgi:hypothetical protein
MKFARHPKKTSSVPPIAGPSIGANAQAEDTNAILLVASLSFEVSRIEAIETA